MTRYCVFLYTIPQFVARQYSKVMKKFAPVFFLFLVAFTAGVIALPAPIEHNWSVEGLYLSIKTPVTDFFKPFLGPSTHMYLFRPFSLLLLKILYLLFGSHIVFYRIYKALSLSFFPIAVYIYLNNLSPQKERRNFWIAILCILTPPVLISTYMIVAEDVPGSFLLFSSLALFLCLLKDTHHEKPPLVFWFHACVLMTCLLRETSRTHLFFLLGLHFLHARKSLSPDVKKHALYALGTCGFITLISIFLMSRVATTPWLKLPPTPAHQYFLIQNAFHQIIGSISFSAMTMMIFTYLAQKVYAKKRPRFFIFLLLGLLFLFIKNQPLISFSYIGLYAFSQTRIIPVATFLFIIIVLSKLKSSCMEEKFCAQAILLIFFSTVGATLFLKTVREDLPSRTFISILPFLFYFVIQSAGSLHALYIEQRQKGHRSLFLRFARTYFFINLALYFLSSPLNVAFETQQHAFAEDESKSFLAQKPLKNTLLFYTNDAFPTNPEDFYFRNPIRKNKNLDPHLFFVLDPFKKGNSPLETQQKLKEEMCLKAAGLYVHVDFKGKRGHEKLMVTWPKQFTGFKKTAYIHMVHERTNLNRPSLSPSFEGDFTPYAHDSLSEFIPAGKFSSRGYWENSMPAVIQKYRYSLSSDLENLFEALHMTPLYQNSFPYIQFPQSIEEAWFWEKMNYSLILYGASQAKVYFLNMSNLNCYDVLHLKLGTRIIPREFYSQP